MIYCDGGSTYSKILYPDGRVRIIPTMEMLEDETTCFDVATGHAARGRCNLYVNELIALAHGTLSMIDDENFTVVDVGSRDTKYVTVTNRRVSGLDWNTSCGGNLGFTLELLGQYYHIDYNLLKPDSRKIPVACGLLAIEKILDEINNGSAPGQAIAMFMNGLCHNVYQFCRSPAIIYLSGGLTENNCFRQTLGNYCEVKPLGRDVLLRGLMEISKTGN